MSSVWLDLLGAETKYYGDRYRTRVIEAGSGDPLLLIHGVGGHAEVWSRNVLRLAEHYRVLAVDLLWHGLSSKPDVPETPMEGYVDQLADLLESLDISAVRIEGESLGGAVAIGFALRYPEKVTGLILNTTAGVAAETPAASSAIDDLRNRSIAGLMNPTVESVRHRMNWLVAEPDSLTDEIVDIRLALYSRPDVQASLSEIFGFIGRNRTYGVQEFAKLGTIPTLVFWTEKNPGHGPDVGERLHKMIPNSEFVVMPDAAHWPQWEKPAEHDRIVLDFFHGAVSYSPSNP